MNRSASSKSHLLTPAKIREAMQDRELQALLD
jgi:hypothetical protein